MSEMEYEYYRYVSLGMSLGGNAGKISYFHKLCWLKLPTVAGSNAEKMTDIPPEDAICYECHLPIKRVEAGEK